MRRFLFRPLIATAFLAIGAVALLPSMAEACYFFSPQTNYYIEVTGPYPPGGGFSYGGGTPGVDAVYTRAVPFQQENDQIGNQQCDGSEVPTPIVEIAASPQSITAGGSTLVTWSSKYTDSCTINQGIGNVAPNAAGSSTQSPGSTATYTITCSSFWAEPISDSVTVTVNPPAPPTATLVADPSSIAYGGSSTLRSYPSNATYCWIEGVGVVSATAQDARSVSPLSNTTYTLTCNGAGGSATSQATVTVGAQPLPNLVAGPTSVASSVRAGVAVPLSATVSNTGNAAAGSFPNVFEVANVGYVGANGLSLAAGGQGTVSASYAFPGAGTYYVRACADFTAGVVAESNEGDNCGGWATVSVGSPDLTGTANSSVSGTAGQAVTLPATVVNQGGASAGAGFTNTFWIDTDTNTGNGWGTPVEVGAGDLAAGGSAPISASYTFGSPGTYYYALCVDLNSGWTANGSIAESNEGNNCAGWGTVTITTAAQLPDLTPGQPANVTGTVGQPVTLSAPASNIGAGPTNSGFPNTFHVDTSGQGGSYINANGWSASVVNWYNAVLPAGQSATVSASYTWNSPGTYYYDFCTNRDQNWWQPFAESNEGNNCSGWGTVQINPAPPQNQNPVGWLDGANCSVIHGWAQDPDVPDQPIYVHLYVDGPVGGGGTYLGQTAASGYRSDLCGAYGCNHAYTFSTPANYKDGASHSVYAYGINAQGGTNPLLSGSPKSFQCEAPPVMCTGTPTVSIDASPTRVKSGNATTLTWNATNVPGTSPSCTISGPGVNQTVSAGAPPACSIPNGVATPTITTQSTYTITCAGVSDSVTVNVVPEIDEI